MVDLVLTDSLSEAEERRDFPLGWCLKCPLRSEVWLVTVERRVDTKLLLVERRSCWRTHSSTPRHGMYLANASLGSTPTSISIEASSNNCCQQQLNLAQACMGKLWSLDHMRLTFKLLNLPRCT